MEPADISRTPDDEHDQDGHARLRVDPARWYTLTFVGIQDCDGLRGPDEFIELRNCTCGTTLARRARREFTMRFEVYKDKAAEYRWRLLASNGKLAADSGEGYTRREDAHRAIAALLLAINDVVIVDA
jgi:uncharacterized protein YegP (UPF0339 family)